MYRIGYLNANSLPDGKFAQAVSLLETSFDFLFIAEHWYQYHESRLGHPLIHSSTHWPAILSSARNTGRQHGGIYLLANRSSQLAIQSTTCTEHSIVVSLPNFGFAGVYYPPYSLTNTNLEADLTQIRSVDHLVGDINTRFSCNPSTTKKQHPASHVPRSLLFQSWAATNNMIHLSDNLSHNTADNIPDHAFSKINLQSAFSLNFIPTHTLSFQTDHRYLLQLHLSIPSPNRPMESPCQAKSTTPLRFRVQRLREPEIASKYCNA